MQRGASRNVSSRCRDEPLARVGCKVFPCRIETPFSANQAMEPAKGPRHFIAVDVDQNRDNLGDRACTNLKWLIKHKGMRLPCRNDGHCTVFKLIVTNTDADFTRFLWCPSWHAMPDVLAVDVPYHVGVSRDTVSTTVEKISGQRVLLKHAKIDAGDVDRGWNTGNNRDVVGCENAVVLSSDFDQA